MMQKKYLIGAALAVVAIAVAVAGVRSPAKNASIPSDEDGTQAIFAEKSIELGAVSVAAQPEIAADGKLRFTIALNTHSVDLSQFSVEDQLRLRIGGEEIAPASSDNEAGSGPASHHREIIAAFPYSGSPAFTLVIRNLGGVGEAELSWPPVHADRRASDAMQRSSP